MFYIVSTSLVLGFSFLFSESIFYSFLSVVFFVFFMVSSYYLKHRCFVLSLIFLFSFFPVLVSNLHIETGGYILEQRVYGEVNNATVRLAFYLMLYFVFFFFFVGVLTRRKIFFRVSVRIK